MLVLLSTGASAQAIGDQLEIKLPTVKRHLENTYRKLGAGNRIDAVRHYLLSEPSDPIAAGGEERTDG